MKKVLVLPLLVIFFLSSGEASRKTDVKSIRYFAYKNYTRIVVDLAGTVEFAAHRIEKPDRLFFDLKNCVISQSLKNSIPIDNGTLKAVRFAQFDANTVRVVLDIDKLKKYTAFMLEDPNRLVIDVYPEADVKDKDETTDNHKIAPNQGPYKINTIVIDPGHGGKDPGAIGPGGLQEKDITLYVGKKLGEILKDKHGVNIIYTRDKDVFVPLNERTEIANSKKADLFISVHTNASEKRTARGIETYFLNWTNDSEALRVAARENKISIAKMQKIQDGLQMILQDLARNNKKEESMRLAQSVQSAMVDTLKKDYSNIENLGIKYAFFYVLVGAEMPSVLVEISFISNHDEEKRLSDSVYKNKIAEAIAIGIDAYISQSTLIVNNSANSASGG